MIKNSENKMVTESETKSAKLARSKKAQREQWVCGNCARIKISEVKPETCSCKKPKYSK